MHGFRNGTAKTKVREAGSSAAMASLPRDFFLHNLCTALPLLREETYLHRKIGREKKLPQEGGRRNEGTDLYEEHTNRHIHFYL